MGQETPKNADTEREMQIAQLAQDARELTSGVSRLMGETGTALVGIAQRNRTNRRWILALGLSLFLDVALTVAMVFAYSNGQHNTERIDRLTSNVRVQLCGALALFVNADTPAANAAAKARGDDMEVRAKSFRSIRRSYEDLDCKEFVR